MKESYKSRFEQRIPLTSNHFADADHNTVIKRTEAIRPQIFNAIGKWAKQATADESVANLKLPQRQKVNKVENGKGDLEWDLLSEHNHKKSRKIEGLLENQENSNSPPITMEYLKQYL